MRTNRKRADVRIVSETDMPAIERDKALTKSRRVSRVMRLAKAQLGEASASVVARSPKSARWFCLQVLPNHDFRVEALLKHADVNVLLPRERWSVVRRGRKIESERPVIPGYIPVRFVPSPAAFNGLKSLRGVFDFVKGADGYHVIRDKDILPFRMLLPADLDSAEIDRTIGERSRCEITMGPFFGWECVVTAVRWCRDARASVAINMHGRVFEIDSIPVAFLRKL